jgi:ATP-dependent RNA helicase DDX41
VRRFGVASSPSIVPSAPSPSVGRTGRCGKTGVATTFINKAVDEHLLLDLKHLLVEAKQRVPPVLLALEDPADLHSGDGELGAGCAYCGGLGHRITECPKLEHQRRQMAGPRKDMMRGGEW